MTEPTPTEAAADREVSGGRRCADAMLSAAIKASGYQGEIQNFVSYSPGLLDASADLAAAFEDTYTIVQYPTVEEGGADDISRPRARASSSRSAP